MTAYISLELLSFCLYVLASYARSSPRSNEGGLKYIIIGAFSSAILLYGISMVYSTIGMTRFADISTALMSAGDVSPALWVGVAMILVGLGFKVAAVPFHMWAPDVYEGSPYPITAYLAIGSKAGGLRTGAPFSRRRVCASRRTMGPVAAHCGGTGRGDHAGG